MDDRAEEILRFWVDEAGPGAWYAVDAEFDSRIRRDYRELWQAASGGELAAWQVAPRSCLALLIVLDQFPRNMFRGSEMAFSSDPAARKVAKTAIGRGLDRQIEMPARQFFYLPLMHSENTADQDRSVRLFMLAGDGSDNLEHARAHREIVRRYGRFPYRNEVLGRTSTPPEREFLEAGGYTTALADIRAHATERA